MVSVQEKLSVLSDDMVFSLIPLFSTVTGFFKKNYIN